jgi:hypothetical protein
MGVRPAAANVAIAATAMRASGSGRARSRRVTSHAATSTAAVRPMYGSAAALNTPTQAAAAIAARAAIPTGRSLSSSSRASAASVAKPANIATSLMLPWSAYWYSRFENDARTATSAAAQRDRPERDASTNSAIAPSAASAASRPW